MCLGSLDLYSALISEYFLALQVLNQDMEIILFCSFPYVKQIHKTLKIK